jgi:hypothetical protein
MKNKIIATLVAFGLVGSASALDINENLSINGFIDGSYQHAENAATTQGLGVDEIELDFLFNVGGASGAIHLDDTDDGTGTSDVNVEQAFIGYSLENGVGFTLGRYGSLLGFEREDPTGLYTFSRAYGVNSGFNLGDVDTTVNEGLRVSYSSDVFGLDVSFQNESNGDIETNELDLEIAFTYSGIENLAIGGGYHFDNEADNANETDVLNIHATTTMGKFLLGVEYTELDNAGADLDGWMVLADYDISEKLGMVFRVSSNELAGNSDYEKVSLAPNYSLSDSLGVILEYSDVENAGTDGNELALEFLFTF